MAQSLLSTGLVITLLSLIHSLEEGVTTYFFIGLAWSSIFFIAASLVVKGENNGKN